MKLHFLFFLFALLISLGLLAKDSILIEQVNEIKNSCIENMEVDNSEDRLNFHKTYFMAGALFTGKENSNKTFTQVFIRSSKQILPKNEFHTVQSSVLKPGMGWFCLRAGLKILKNPHRHRIVGQVIQEILRDFKSNLAKSKKEKGQINLVGSSYGAVIAAQVAIFLLRNQNKKFFRFDLRKISKINLTLTGSPINLKSEIITEMHNYQNTPSSSKVNFQFKDLSNVDDPLVHSLGRTPNERVNNLLNLSSQLVSQGPMSVFQKHFEGMKDLKRVENVMQYLYIDSAGHGNEMKCVVNTILSSYNISSI